MHKLRLGNDVVTAVFVLGTLNFCLGIALAMAVDRIVLSPVPRLSDLLKLQWLRKTGSRESIPVTPSGENLSAAAETPVRQGSSHDWAGVLAQEGIATSSPLTDLLWVTKLQTHRMRSRAVALASEPGDDALDAGELRTVVTQWNDMLGEWLKLATKCKPESAAIGARLEESLLDQAFELQSACQALASERQMPQLLLSLIDAANVLRDEIDELLVARTNESGRPGELPTRFKTFGEHGTLTRLGIEELFSEWGKNDPEGLRLVSLALVDLDRFAKLNKTAGPRLADVAIEQFAGLLHAAVRKERGFDRVGRIGGDRFLLFLGDTSPKNAVKGADRVRQTIEASSCRFGNESMPMTTSCAVIGMGKGETPTQLLQRLSDVISEAKKAGRNLTFCDSGSGPAVVALPQYAVSSSELILQEPSVPSVGEPSGD